MASTLTESEREEHVSDEREGDDCVGLCHSKDGSPKSEELSLSSEGSDEDDETSISPSTAPRTAVPTCSSCCSNSTQAISQPSGVRSICNDGTALVPSVIECHIVGNGPIGVAASQDVVMMNIVPPIELLQIDEVSLTNHVQHDEKEVEKQQKPKSLSIK